MKHWTMLTDSPDKKNNKVLDKSVMLAVYILIVTN